MGTCCGRNYGFNPIDLMRKDSAMDLYDEQRTFFCSELVAKAFKEIGCLRDEFASSQYFPCHFQASKGLKLLKGCSFSNEMEIVCGDRVSVDLEVNAESIEREIEIVSLQKGARITGLQQGKNFFGTNEVPSPFDHQNIINNNFRMC